MADEVDVANDFMDMQLSRALDKIRSHSIEGTGSKECRHCGEAIPLGRQKLGFKVCVHCAESEERRKSLFSS